MNITNDRVPRKSRRSRKADIAQVEVVASAREKSSHSTRVTAAQPDLDIMVAFTAASEPIRTLALELLDSSKEAAAQIFLTRAVRVLLDLAPSHAAVEAASASTDYGVLLSVLQSPEVLDKLVEADPLAQAKLRGIEAKKRPPGC